MNDFYPVSAWVHSRNISEGSLIFLFISGKGIYSNEEILWLKRSLSGPGFDPWAHRRTNSVNARAVLFPEWISLIFRKLSAGFSPLQ
jgi:hypothetical protein